MAIVAKLRYSTTDLLLDGSDAYTITRWVAGSSVRGEDVVETMEVRVTDSSDDNLAAEIQKLDDLILRVDRYRENPSYTTPVWLHAKRSGETGERRALVKRMSYAPTVPEFGAEAVGNATRLQLEIVRAGFWEDATGATPGGTINTSSDAGTVDYTVNGDVVGDVPARLSILAAFNSSVDLDRVWLAIRSTNAREQLANFELTWECEDGTNEGVAADDATTETNTASPGSGAGAYVDVTPTASNTWEKYLTLTVGDVYTSSADYDAAFGVFQWLLRHKLGAAGTFQLQLRFGYDDMDDAEFVRQGITETTSTSWEYSAMGVQQLPLRNPKALGVNVMGWDYEGSLAVQIWGKRTSGSGHIYLDCLHPMAVDEGYLFLSGIERGDGSPIAFGVGQSPAGEWSEATYNVSGGNKLMTIGTIDQMAFGFPPGDGRLDIVVARASSSVLTDSLTIAAGTTWYERWRSLRGSE